MKIKLKLYASLSEYLPEGAIDNTIEVDVPDDASPNSVIDRFQVPRELSHLVLVNGVFAYQSEREAAILKEGDILAIWPPIAGG